MDTRREKPAQPHSQRLERTADTYPRTDLTSRFDSNIRKSQIVAVYWR